MAELVRSGLAGFLIKSVLDTDFRELALSDPEAAFVGFDLSADEKAILSSSDERVLSLLGRALQYSVPEKHGEEPADEHSNEPANFPLQSLPEINLRLRLIPHAVNSPGEDLELGYAASLHPWTDNPAGWDQPADGATEPESVAAAVDWMIRVAPSVISVPGAGSKLAYSASIQPPPSAVGRVLPQGQKQPGDGLTPPSRYFGDSLAARQAATKAGQAEPDQRRQKLLELVSALRRGDDHA